MSKENKQKIAHSIKKDLFYMTLLALTGSAALRDEESIAHKDSRASRLSTAREVVRLMAECCGIILKKSYRYVRCPD